MLDSNMKMTYILSMKHLIKLINYIILEVIRVQSWSLHMCTIMHHGWVEWPYFVLIHLCQPYSWPYIIPKPLSLSVSSIFHVSLSRNSTQHLLRLSMWMSFLSLFWNQQNMEQEQSNTFIYLVFVFFKGRATQEQLLIFAPHIFISNTFNFIDKNQFEIVYLIWFKIGCRCLSWVLFINLTNLFSIELYIYLEVTK